jgi:hypothetical protein
MRAEEGVEVRRIVLVATAVSKNWMQKMAPNFDTLLLGSAEV